MYAGFDDVQVRYKELGRRVLQEWINDQDDSPYEDDGTLSLDWIDWCMIADFDPKKLAEKLMKVRNGP